VGRLPIGATVKVDHVLNVFTSVAMHEEPGTHGAPLLALFGFARESLPPSRVTDGKKESIAEPDTERPLGPPSALRQMVVLARGRLQLWIILLACP
jgi:hypothetical protein